MVRDRLCAQLRVEAAQSRRRGHDAAAEIADAQAVMLADPAWAEDAADRLARWETSPGQAFRLAAAAIADAYRGLDDAYLRARASDVDGLIERLLGMVEPQARVGFAPLPETSVILLADELTTAAALALDPARVRGIVTARGAPSAHSSIIVHALGIPMLVGTGLPADWRTCLAGRNAILDLRGRR